MASEGQGWDTSTAFIRRTFSVCIEAGRRAGGREGPDLWEAYRLLGTGMHTMEDLLAHSNWCEIALRKMGHEEVFCHVGDDGMIGVLCTFTGLKKFLVIINTPSGPAPPLVTGSFGGKYSLGNFHHDFLLIDSFHRCRFYPLPHGRSDRVRFIAIHYIVNFLIIKPNNSHISQASVTDLTQKMKDVSNVKITHRL